MAVNIQFPSRFPKFQYYIQFETPIFQMNHSNAIQFPKNLAKKKSLATISNAIQFPKKFGKKKLYKKARNQARPELKRARA